MSARYLSDELDDEEGLSVDVLSVALELVDFDSVVAGFSAFVEGSPFDSPGDVFFRA